MWIFSKFTEGEQTLCWRFDDELWTRCNRPRCPLARLFGLQCFNMGHNGHGINLYCVIMTLMCIIMYKSEDIHLNNFFDARSAEEIILVNIEGE